MIKVVLVAFIMLYTGTESGVRVRLEVIDIPTIRECETRAGMMKSYASKWKHVGIRVYTQCEATFARQDR